MAPFSQNQRQLNPIAPGNRGREATDWVNAKHHDEVAFDHAPVGSAIWIKYGQALKEAGNVAQAEAAYRRALTDGPIVADTYLQLGHVLKLQGKLKEAQAAYLRAFVRNPSLAEPQDELKGLGWSGAELAQLCDMLEADESARSNQKPIPVDSSFAEIRGYNGDSSLPADTAVAPTQQRNNHLPAISETNSQDTATAQLWLGNFDPNWYLNRYPDVARTKIDPFEHFLKHGLSEGRAPTPEAARFDANWYRTHYPDVAQSGMDPLEHFLRYGIKEKRKPNAEEASVESWGAVIDAEIHCLKEPSFHNEAALFVTHSPHGRLKPHVRHYLDSLKRQGIAIVLIVAADVAFADCDTNLSNTIDGLFIRQNVGYDFAAWAHILRLRPQCFDVDILYLLNDSVIGPTNDADFSWLLSEMRQNSADVVGLTESLEGGWHIQSYFLALKRRSLSSVVLHKFIGNVVSCKNKQDVIDEYELKLAPALKSAGLRCDVVFRESRNPTIYHWRYLLESRFPFVKVNVIDGRFPDADSSGWRDVLEAQGYEVELADHALAETKTPPLPSAAEDRLLPPSCATPFEPCSRSKVAFIGPWNYSNGLAFASRAYISALRHTGFDVNLYPIKRPFHIHRQVAPAVDICDFSGRPDVATVHLNPDGWPGLLTDSQRRIIEGARLSVGLWVWEMAELPENWFPAFDQLAAIWAPSRYCAEIFAARAKVPVDVIPYVVTVPPPNISLTSAEISSREVGLSQGERIILYAFDGSSYLIRKNPFALVRSFARSGLAGMGWRLVLKVKHLFDSPAEGELLQQMVERTDGVVLIDRLLNQREMNALMRAANIYASPHCAEGFGLTIAESMAMGKVVVATDYGGSRDLLDAECGFPVRYRLCSLDDDHGHYTRDGGVWAQIDEDHLSQSLLDAAGLVMSGDLRLGEVARRRISELLSPAAVAAKMRESISRLQNQG